MLKNIAINGFGRIGRVIFNIIHQRQKSNLTKLQVTAINDLTSIDTLAHLLKYDSVHGRFDGQIDIDKNCLIVDGQRIQVFSEKEPSNLPWQKLEINTAVESTGFFLSREKAAKHLQAGAKKVVISAPYKGQPADATICYGINHNIYSQNMNVISTASCTTNCLVPVAKVLHDKWGIESALVTTVHSYTNDQSLLDSPHSDLRRARSAALSMIPTTTGAAKAVSLVLPELKDKFDGLAIRVPTPNVSCIDLVANLQTPATAQEINNELKLASQNHLKGILGYTDEPIVSTDILKTKESSIIDGLCTSEVGNKMVKVLSWYDNEWGFANRAVDLVDFIS